MFIVLTTVCMKNKGVCVFVCVCVCVCLVAPHFQKMLRIHFWLFPDQLESYCLHTKIHAPDLDKSQNSATSSLDGKSLQNDCVMSWGLIPGMEVCVVHSVQNVSAAQSWRHKNKFGYQGANPLDLKQRRQIHVERRVCLTMADLSSYWLKCCFIFWPQVTKHKLISHLQIGLDEAATQQSSGLILLGHLLLVLNGKRDINISHDLISGLKVAVVPAINIFYQFNSVL